MRGVTTTIIAAALLGLTTAAMAADFDGDWTVQVTTERGTCDHAYSYDVSVAHGRIEYRNYTSVTLHGTVSPQGAVMVSIRHFDDGAEGTGHLGGRSGSGGWRGAGKQGACSGRWEAHRR